MTARTMMDPSSPPLSVKSARKYPGLPSPPLTPDSPRTAESPTGVTDIEDFLHARQQQTELQEQLLSRTGDKEQRQSIIRRNAEKAAEKRRLMAAGYMGDNSAIEEMREHLGLEQEKTAPSITRQALMDTIRKQREEDHALAMAEMYRRTQLEKKNSAKKVASKYSGLSKGLGVVTDNNKVCPTPSRDSLRTFLLSDDGKKYRRMSQSLSSGGASGSGDLDQSQSDNLSGGGSIPSMSRSEQRWHSRPELSHRLNSSASLLSGGHVKRSEFDDDTSNTEVDEDESDGEADLGEMKDESAKSIQLVPSTPATPVATTPSQSSGPKSILKRTSTVGSTGSLQHLAQNSHQPEDPKRSMLNALYDGGKTMSLHGLTVDNSTSHQRRTSADPSTPTSVSSSRSKQLDQRRSKSSRKLQDGSSRKDSNRKLSDSSHKLQDRSSRHESSSSRKSSMRDTSRRRESIDSRDSNVSRKSSTSSSRRESSSTKQDDARDNNKLSRKSSMRDSSSRGTHNESSSSKDDGRDKQLNRSSSGRRLASMSRAKSARRLEAQRGQGGGSRRKGLVKTNSSSLSVASESSSSQLSNKEKKESKSVGRIRSSGSELSNASSRDYSRRESGTSDRGRESTSRKESGERGRDNPRKETGERTRTTRARSRSRSKSRTRRTCGGGGGGGHEDRDRSRRASRSRSRARRQTTKNPVSKSDLAAAVATAADRRSSAAGEQDSPQDRDRRTSRRRVSRARSEHNMKRRSSLRNGETQSLDEGEEETFSSSKEKMMEMPDLQLFEGDEQHLLSPSTTTDELKNANSNDDDFTKSKKTKRKSISMKLSVPFLGKKKTHQQLDTSNSSSKF